MNAAVKLAAACAVIAMSLPALAQEASPKPSDDKAATAPENPIFSVRDDDAEKAKEILDADPNAVKARDGEGSTALHCLARSRTLVMSFQSNGMGTSEDVTATNVPPVAMLLISRGADVNARDNMDATPLHWAAINNKIALSKFLIEKGSDVNIAAEKGNPEGLTPLILAVSGRHTAISKLLLSNGADVNKPDKSGTTPLIYAASNDDTNSIAMLLAGGADINKTDKDGLTPLHTAVSYKAAHAVALLLKNKADVGAKTAKGKTALALATETGRTDIEALLQSDRAK